MDRYATPKQVSFIDRLVVDRDWESPAYVGIDVQARVRDITQRQAAGLSIREASQIIHLLKACPRKVSALAAPGYYVRDGRVFVVVANKAGTATYAKEMVVVNGRGKWTYSPGTGRDIAREGLVPLTVAEAARLGRLHGACMVCGRSLTDPASVERGIGPVCSRKIA